MKRVTLAVLTLLATSTIADAACVLRDLTGRWQTYSFGQFTNTKAAFYQSCLATITSRGDVRTSCVDSGGANTSSSGRVVAANLANCSFFIEFPSSTVLVTIARDKDTGAGIANFNGGIFQFTATRL